MLQLRVNNRELSQILQNTRYLDNLAHRNIRGFGYVYEKLVGDVHLPFVFNDINVIHNTYGINMLEPGVADKTDIDVLVNNINNLYENCNEDKVMVIKVYANLDLYPEIIDALTATDLIQSVPDTIQALYNKCMQQMKDRESITSEVIIKAYQFRGKQGIITLCNIDDHNQASQDFLTLGLIPVLFKNLATRFDEVETNFFKVLVARSQVKRISNVKPTEAFNKLQDLDKYIDRLIDIRTRNACQQIVENRLREARLRVEQCERQANSILRDYETILTTWRNAQIACNDVESKVDTMLDEVTQSLKIEGIKTVSFSNNKIYVTFVTPVKFYDVDEVECVVRNRDGWIKQFLQDVFIDQIYKLNIYTKIGFSFNDDTQFSPPSQADLDDLIRYNAMYNPHTHFFNCLGDYHAQLVKAHSDKDIMLFMNLALASTRSINFRDGAVINRWCNDLQSGGYTRWDGTNVLDAKCLIDENDEKHSIREIYLQPRVARDVDVEDL